MSMSIAGQTVEHRETQWGVDDTFEGETTVIPFNAEEDARRYSEFLTGSKVVIRNVYTTAWADAPGVSGASSDADASAT